MRKAFFLLTYEPNEVNIKFIKDLNKAREIEAYIIVDNNKYIPNTIDEKFILQLDDNECYNDGFRNVNFVIKKKVTAWDKVLYFLCRIFRDIDFAWIVEDDVFIPSIESVLAMTNKYSSYDLVTATDEGNTRELRNYWHWKYMPKYMNNSSLTLSIDSKYDPSRGWFKSMVCAMGISRNLLYIINLHVLAYKQLMFIEFLFNTLCHQAGLRNVIAEEFKYIIWRKNKKESDWNNDDILELNESKKYWFHPMKDKLLHKEIRGY